MKKVQLGTLLRREGKTSEDVIKWAYYGYGIFSCSGECKVKDLPPQVKYAKCFDIQDGQYCVDGAL